MTFSSCPELWEREQSDWSHFDTSSNTVTLRRAVSFSRELSTWPSNWCPSSQKMNKQTSPGSKSEKYFMVPVYWSYFYSFAGAVIFFFKFWSRLCHSLSVAPKSPCIESLASSACSCWEVGTSEGFFGHGGVCSGMDFLEGDQYWISWQQGRLLQSMS